MFCVKTVMKYVHMVCVKTVKVLQILDPNIEFFTHKNE
jgi:hypothetical protein